MRFAGVFAPDEVQRLHDALDGADAVLVLTMKDAIPDLNRMGAALEIPVWHVPMTGRCTPTVRELASLLRCSSHINEPAFICKSGLNRSAFAACAHRLNRIGGACTCEDVQRAVDDARATNPRAFERDKWRYVQRLYWVFGNPAPRMWKLETPFMRPPLETHLDVGCGSGGSLRLGGSGFLTSHLPLNTLYVGVEPAAHLREAAIANLTHAQIMVGDHENIPELPGNRLATSCVASLSLHFATDMPRAARSYARRLKPGAGLLVSLPHAGLVEYLLRHDKRERDTTDDETEAGFRVERRAPRRGQDRVAFFFSGAIADGQIEPLVNMWDVLDAFHPYFVLDHEPSNDVDHVMQSYIVFLRLIRRETSVMEDDIDIDVEAGYTPSEQGGGEKTAWMRDGIRRYRNAFANHFAALIHGTRDVDDRSRRLSFGYEAFPLLVPSIPVRALHTPPIMFRDFIPPMPRAASIQALRSLARNTRLIATLKADGEMALRIGEWMLMRNDVFHRCSPSGPPAWGEVVQGEFITFEFLDGTTLADRIVGVDKPWVSKMNELDVNGRLPQDGIIVSHPMAPAGFGGLKCKPFHGVDALLTGSNSAKLSDGTALTFVYRANIRPVTYNQTHPVIVELVFDEDGNLEFLKTRPDKCAPNSKETFASELAAARSPIDNEVLKDFVDTNASVSYCQHVVRTRLSIQHPDRAVCLKCRAVGFLGDLFPNLKRLTYARALARVELPSNLTVSQSQMLSATFRRLGRIEKTAPNVIDQVMISYPNPEDAYAETVKAILCETPIVKSCARLLAKKLLMAE